MSEIVNAKITGTMLGYEDHGILSCYVTVEWPRGGVSFGGYVLDAPAEPRGSGKRVGTVYGTQYIIELMEAVGVSKWESLKGTHVRLETGGWGTKAKRIGHIMEDKWFDPEELANRLRATT